MNKKFKVDLFKLKMQLSEKSLLKMYSHVFYQNKQTANLQPEHIFTKNNSKVLNKYDNSLLFDSKKQIQKKSLKLGAAFLCHFPSESS